MTLLIEQGLDFEEVKDPPSQKDEYLARSPMGKMPSIEVDGRYMSESLAIFEYVERLQPELLFNEPVGDDTKAEVKADLGKGMRAVSRLAVCDPYAIGEALTIADLYTFYCFGLAGMLATNVLGSDPLADRPEIAALLGRLAERPSIARVSAEAAG